LPTQRLVSALSPPLPIAVAQRLAEQFTSVRHDVGTSTLGRAAPGKFVEVFVQALQFLEGGAYEAHPKVDAYLRELDTRQSPLDEGLRICAARVLRAAYSLRNKRNIAHLGAVDPNVYDLSFLCAAAQWALAELVRQCTGWPMEEAGRLLAEIYAPVGDVVEDFGGRTLVLAEGVSIRQEVLLVLRRHYPDAVGGKVIAESLNRRRAGSVRNELAAMWREKLVDRGKGQPYHLTAKGRRDADETATLLSGAH